MESPFGLNPPLGREDEAQPDSANASLDRLRNDLQKAGGNLWFGDKKMTGPMIAVEIADAEKAAQKGEVAER